MEWQDMGLVIGARKYGETSVILEVMTRSRGRCLGVVREDVLVRSGQFYNLVTG